MRPGYFTARAWRWFVAFPFAIGLLVYGIAHRAAPHSPPFFAPWSLIP